MTLVDFSGGKPAALQSHRPANWSYPSLGGVLHERDRVTAEPSSDCDASTLYENNPEAAAKGGKKGGSHFLLMHDVYLCGVIIVDCLSKGHLFFLH